ncbi:MAG: tail fiber domain-containing protein [Bacteroidota bacterium]
MKKTILISAICAICTYAHSQSWNLTGNAGTNGSNFIGTTDNVPFKIRTNNAVRMTVNGSGKVGIGTISPAGKLHVKGNTNVSQLIIDASTTQTNMNPLIKLRSSSGSDLMWIHSDDTSNCFIGLNSGRVNNRAGSGTSNTFIGGNAGCSNTTGYSNTAVGRGALNSNTEGNFNTATGAEALYSNTNGYQNTAAGVRALYSNTGGGSNTATGWHAMYLNTSGYENSAYGADALFSNTTGYANTVTGSRAMSFNTTGFENTANGTFALYSNTTGEQNAAFGNNALKLNTTGYHNTASGTGALISNTTGNDNTATGMNALYSTTIGVVNTATGSSALYFNTTGYSNTATGVEALANNTTGHSNTSSGYQALYFNTTGTFNSGFGDFSNPSVGNLDFATAIGADATVNASHKVRIGDASVTVVEGQVGYSFPSDGRFKENIKEDVKGLDFILKLQPVSYNFNRLKFAQHVRQHPTPGMEELLIAESKNRSVGFIAQDVEKIIQQTGFTSFDAVHAPTNETDNYSMGYAEFVVPLVKAVQELSAKNNAQDLLIENLKEEINNLKAGLKQTEIKSPVSAILFQNSPNPFNSETEIKFQLPAKFNSAFLIITDEKGKQMRTYPVESSNSIVIKTGELSAGLYYYLLIIDGITADSKQMIITK